MSYRQILARRPSETITDEEGRLDVERNKDGVDGCEYEIEGTGPIPYL